MKKFLIAFMAMALVSLGYLGWLNHNNETIRIKTEEFPLSKTSSETNSEKDPSPEDYFPAIIPEPLPGGFRDVSIRECSNECRDFAVKEELTYCQEVCGLKAPSEKDQACDTLKDLKQDYCFKDEAISKKDLVLCDKVSDPNIKKTCQNRVTEDIFDR